MNSGVVKYSMPKICEIALIYGQFLERGEVRQLEDLYEAYDEFCELYDEWLKQSLTGKLNDDEAAYITEYMNRVIPIKFGL